MAEAKQRGLLETRLAMDLATLEKKKKEATALAEREAVRAALAKKRKQPKSPEEEAALASKYGAMEPSERAYNILVDLEMIEVN